MLFIGRVDDMCARIAHSYSRRPGKPFPYGRGTTPRARIAVPYRVSRSSVFSQTPPPGSVWGTAPHPHHPSRRTKPRSRVTHCIHTSRVCARQSPCTPTANGRGGLPSPVIRACILHKRRALISLMDTHDPHACIPRRTVGWLSRSLPPTPRSEESLPGRISIALNYQCFDGNLRD